VFNNKRITLYLDIIPNVYNHKAINTKNHMVQFICIQLTYLKKKNQILIKLFEFYLHFFFITDKVFSIVEKSEDN